MWGQWGLGPEACMGSKCHHFHNSKFHCFPSMLWLLFIAYTSNCLWYILCVKAEKRFTHQMLTLGECVLGGGHWHKVQAVLHRHLSHAILWYTIKKGWKRRQYIASVILRWVEIIETQLPKFSIKPSSVTLTLHLPFCASWISWYPCGS